MLTGQGNKARAHRQQRCMLCRRGRKGAFEVGKKESPYFSFRRPLGYVQVMWGLYTPAVCDTKISVKDLGRNRYLRASTLK